ncbi:MAG: glycerol-3-phosphate 1-O-acyltransferase PlsY [Oscillospiraceae bacterium]|nr:glycerol-3-phosphate 1-O-acyltransferase PlsY [Oscillospiraceae bacterium]
MTIGDRPGDTIVMAALCIATIAYFCGCFNGAVIVSKYILHDDVRNHGSGNAGLTNFHRTFGGGLTAVVILTDMLKAVVALWLSGVVLRYFFPGESGIVLVTAEYWAALFCLLGHMFPCMFQFKGGKGILSGGTIALIIDWRVALVVWGGFLILVILTRYVSLGSVWAGVSFPFISWYCYPNPAVVVLAFLCGGLVVWQHRGNIQRLVQGNERKLSFHKKKEGKQ